MSKFETLYKKIINEDMDHLAAAPMVLTPEVTEYVLNLMATREGMSVESYLTAAKEALGIANIEMSDEDLAEKLVQKALNSMPLQDVETLHRMARLKRESLWDNINAKKKAGRKSSSKNSKAYKAAVKAGKKLSS